MTPVCDCHGEPMLRVVDKRRPNSYWTCLVRARERSRKSNARWRLNHPARKRRDNERRLRVGNTYMGMCGFTDSEIKEMVHGKTD